MHGMRQLAAQLATAPVRPAACIIGEPTSMQVVVANKGAAGYRVKVRGHSVHSSLRDQGVSAVEYAAEIVGLAESLQREYRDLEQKASADEEKVKKLAFLQKDKAVWPRIWQEIDNALPPLPPELAKAMAAGPEGFRKAVEAAGGRLDRGERPIVFIQSLGVKYGKDTRELYEACRGSASGVLSPGQTNAPAAGTTPGGPGFVVRIEGRTPYKSGPRFIEDTFLKKLGEQPADIVLLDIYMPDMDGWEVLERKNADATIRPIPVIIVSAHDPAEGPPTSQLLAVAMGDGLSVDQLLRVSLQVSTALVTPNEPECPEL